MGAVPAVKLSVEEYLSQDRIAEVKCEYHDGELFPVADSSADHAHIAANTITALTVRLQSSECRVFASSLRVRVSPTKFLYPDILVVCGKIILTGEPAETTTNPKVIVEVLSPATTGYDYGQKFANYRRLASFQEYLLIAQDAPRVEVFRRASENQWTLTTYEGSDAIVGVEALGISLPLAEIYSGVDDLAS